MVNVLMKICPEIRQVYIGNFIDHPLARKVRVTHYNRQRNTGEKNTGHKVDIFKSTELDNSEQNQPYQSACSPFFRC